MATTARRGDEGQGGGPDTTMRYGSDLAAQIIRDLGIEYIALNPGASYRGLHDSIVNFDDGKTENGRPEMVQCTHEAIAVATAHGYAKASGRYMAVGLHNVVGLQHASMAIFNAWCDRVPMLLIGGTGPMRVESRRPWIDWIHTALVQGNLIRDFVKWDDQPASHLSLIESLLRGARIANTEPQGPVYVCLDAALQEDELGPGKLALPDALARSAPPSPPAAQADALERIAAAVRSASFPVVLAGRFARSEAAFSGLSDLAGRWGLPVVDLGDRLNLATTHPMNLTADAREALSRADVVVALDVKDLAGPLSAIDRTNRTTVSILDPAARVFSIGLEDYMTRGWIADYQSLYPATESVLGDTAACLPVLDELLGDPGGAPSRRRAEVEEWHGRLRSGAARQAEEELEESPVSLATLAGTLQSVLAGDEFVVANGDLRGWVGRLFELDRVRQHLGPSAGGGLGYGIGATIGACLAHRGTGRAVLDIQSDGDLMMMPGGLWTLAHCALPALIVMNNNRSYYNDEEHQFNLAKVRNRDEERAGIGTAITSPDIDFARLAESQGVEGIGPIDSGSLLRPALERALSIVKHEQRPVLVDVITKPR